MISVVVQTVREKGVTALWRGITPTLLGVIPYAGTSFFTYETLKQQYQTTYSSPPPPLQRLAFGAFAGTPTIISHTVYLGTVCVCMCVSRAVRAERELSPGHCPSPYADRRSSNQGDLSDHTAHSTLRLHDGGCEGAVQGRVHELDQGTSGSHY